MIFKDRIDAGKQLANLLNSFRGNAVVYAIPRGGVVIGAQIAKSLNAPLDLIITRKIGHPNQQEYAIGAVTQSGKTFYNETAISEISEIYLNSEAEKQKVEAKRRHEVYLQGKAPILCKGKIAILADDGIATGLTIKAAIQELKIYYNPKKIIVAVPVVPFELVPQLKANDVEIIAVEIPKYFTSAVGSYYESFPPVSDEEVVEILQRSNEDI